MLSIFNRQLQRSPGLYTSLGKLMLAEREPEGRKQRHMFSLRVHWVVLDLGEGRSLS